MNPIAILVAMVLAAGAGAVTNGWRLDAAHQRAMTAKQGEYDQLADKVREQNRGIERLAATTAAADERRKLAESYAADITKRIGNRARDVANSTATDCNGVLKEAWGTWQ